ncbi:MAG: hypothetical protein PHN56_04855 [Candidatus Nanoarchaeia archaeon]|nr:hypothetical protein [Candidatus Nanoarchaeia archaeon]
MITCLNCNNDLILAIDVKNNDFKCKDCSEKYDLLFDKKVLKIINKNHQLSFFINDLSNCDSKFSLKNVYEMYNKGYLDCVKMLNSKYNQSDNIWHLSVNKLKEKISQNINLKINTILNSNTESYICSSCKANYSSNEALFNNFSCIMCLNQLVINNNFEEVEHLKENLILIEHNGFIPF